MTVTSVVPDRKALSLTLTAEYPATVEQVWQLWADPRLLERWWGPSGFPASVSRHELEPDGVVAYAMTGPDGASYPGWWRITEVDAPTSLGFVDGFGDVGSEPSPDQPQTATRVEISDAGGGTTRMVVRSSFPSAEAMEQLISMGAVDGMTEAMGQTDALLAGAAAG